MIDCSRKLAEQVSKVDWSLCGDACVLHVRPDSVVALTSWGILPARHIAFWCSCGKWWQAMRWWWTIALFSNARTFWWASRPALHHPLQPLFPVPLIHANKSHRSLLFLLCSVLCICYSQHPPTPPPPNSCNDSSSVLADEMVLERQAPKDKICSFTIQTVTPMHLYSFDPVH